MHIAIKWSMDDVQDAITEAIQIPPQKPRTPTEILRLAFVVEFSSYFSKDFAIKVFVNASSIDYQPTGDDLGPLMVHPSLVALMMEYREALTEPYGAPWYGDSDMNGDSDTNEKNEKKWLSENFESFGFKPRA